MITIFTAGHIGRDATSRTQESSGATIATFSLAARRWDGSTEWLSCSLKGQRAEDLLPHLKKGTGIAINGEAYAEAWVDKETKEVRCGLRVWVTDLCFVGRKPDQPVAGELRVEEPEPVG
jgi:single-stranded DNA-binding protein